eukprot:6208912-Amphidinium_carterae.1
MAMISCLITWQKDAPTRGSCTNGDGDEVDILCCLVLVPGTWVFDKRDAGHCTPICKSQSADSST